MSSYYDGAGTGRHRNVRPVLHRKNLHAQHHKELSFPEKLSTPMELR